MKFERPLQPKELDLLDHKLDQIKEKKKSNVKFAAGWTVLSLIIGTIAYFKIDPESINTLYITVASFIGIGIWNLIKDRSFLKEKEKSIAHLKARNLITVVEVRSETYYLLEEQEDEGDFFLFQLPDNKIFSFGGQDFYECDEFPTNHFEIVEGRGIKNELLILKTHIYGEKIKPLKTIRGKEKWDMLGSAQYPDPYKLTVSEGQITHLSQNPDA